MKASVMTQKLLKPVSLARKVDDESLFSGVKIRWRALTKSEQFVCANIVLLPVWWVSGLYPYMPLLLLMGVAFSEWRRYGELRLKRPSWAVVASSALILYGYVSSALLFLGLHPFVELPLLASINPNGFVKTLLGFAVPVLLWYIQSNNIRVRSRVVAWACSVSVVQMIVLWVIFQGVFSASSYNPPSTLYGLFTGKGDWGTSSSEANYLVPYKSTDHVLGNLARFSFFFHGPFALAMFVGLVGLLALDIKNRLWSTLLLVACVFLLFVSGTRSAWVAFPVVIFVRYLFTAGKAWGPAFSCTLVAITCFATLSLPPVTNLALSSYTDTTATVGELRQDSTETRGAIYTETMKRIPDNLLFGHVVTGPLAVAGDDLTVIGTHSYILGNLLYQGGLIAFGLFGVYWLSLNIWLYDTRVGRPTSCFLGLLFFLLNYPVSENAHTITMGILLCMILREPTVKSFRRSAV